MEFWLDGCTSCLNTMVGLEYAVDKWHFLLNSGINFCILQYVFDLMFDTKRMMIDDPDVPLNNITWD